MMLPIVFAVARRISEKSVLVFGIPTAAAFSVMHVFLPPHPGPVTASSPEFYDANIGLVLLIGLIIAYPLWHVVELHVGPLRRRPHLHPHPHHLR